MFVWQLVFQLQGSMLTPYTGAVTYCPPEDSAAGLPPMYGPPVPPSYSCVCVPHLDSIAMTDVNMHCNPSQDFGGKDLPGTVFYRHLSDFKAMSRLFLRTIFKKYIYYFQLSLSWNTG